MSVNEPLYNFARAFADQGTKNIIPDSNNEASGLASLINVNGSTVGTLSMSWSTTKAGSKGHYSIAQGATIELTSSGGTKFSSCALQVTLGN